jgi:hypothetical protein
VTDLIYETKKVTCLEEEQQVVEVNNNFAVNSENRHCNNEALGRKYSRDLRILMPAHQHPPRQRTN